MRTVVAGILTNGGKWLAASGADSWLVTVLLSFLSHFTYFALIGVLLLAGMGVPIPEDIPLIIGGWLCNPDHSPIVVNAAEGAVVHVPSLYLMIAAGMFGVLAGDSIVFSIGRRGIDTNNFVARHLRKVMHSKRREKVERHFAKHGNLTVFAGRFMPGFRSIVFAFAGLSRMSYLRFLLIDGLAALISVPVFVWLGYHFAEDINRVFKGIDKVKEFLLPIALVIIVGLVALHFYRRRRLTAQLAAAPVDKPKQPAGIGQGG